MSAEFTIFNSPQLHTVNLGAPRSSHVRVHAYTLRDCTDACDYLVKEQVEWIYGNIHLEGQIFVFENVPDKTAEIIICERPAYGVTAVDANSRQITLSTEYDYAAAHCNYADVEHEIRSYYRLRYRGEKLKRGFVMSNNWGDRNADLAMCHDFVMHELDAAAQLGIDIVQLDDGWQSGTTANSRIKKGVWEGYYAFDPDFWKVNAKKFPDSFYPIAKKASELGITLGLWFSPDSSEDFANTDKDIAVISGLHRDFGAAYFKLDGVKIRSKTCEERYCEFLRKLSEIDGGSLSFNLDITAERRFGYFFAREYGTLFVENRYTDHKSYYPYRTLKNLWMLSRFIPSVKMQFEVLNPRRNAQLYGDDGTAPANYDIDYLFATVMTANPLLWMELQNLNETDKNVLSAIIAKYRSYREEIYPCDVSPIGQEPDGHSFSGFCIRGDSYGHLLLFRDVTGSDSFDFNLPILAEMDISSVIASNAECKYAVNGNNLKVSFSKPRSYLWLKLMKA